MITFKRNKNTNKTTPLNTLSIKNNMTIVSFCPMLFEVTVYKAFADDVDLLYLSSTTFISQPNC